VHDYTTAVGPPNLGLSWSREFLGTDAIGRSTLSRILWGARVSIGISFLATVIAMIVGGLLGLLTAYFGRWLTPVVDVVTNSVLAVPSLLLLLSIVLALTPTIPTLVGALSLIFVPAFMRLTRANAQSQINREFVTAARALGAPSSRVIFREVLPNTLPSLVSYAALVLPSIVVTEGALSYLGFGVQAPVPSWGGMIAQAQQNLSFAAAPALVPCVVLFLTVFALNTLGDHLRVRLDVRDAQL
jgi:peptide/nickel transport system permease protein